MTYYKHTQTDIVEHCNAGKTGYFGVNNSHESLRNRSVTFFVLDYVAFATVDWTRDLSLDVRCVHLNCWLCMCQPMCLQYKQLELALRNVAKLYKR